MGQMGTTLEPQRPVEGSDRVQSARSVRLDRRQTAAASLRLPTSPGARAERKRALRNAGRSRDILSA